VQAAIGKPVPVVACVDFGFHLPLAFLIKVIKNFVTGKAAFLETLSAS